MINPRDLAPCDGIDCNRRYSCQRFKNAKEFKQLIHYEIVLMMPLIASPIHDGNCPHFYPIEGQIQEQKSRYCGSTNPELNSYEP